MNLDHIQLETYFHPIISSKKASIIGYEALIRAFDKQSQRLIYPNELFNLVQNNEELIQFDRTCRDKALHTFKILYQQNKNLLLFLNFETSILDLGVLGSNKIFDLCCKLEIPPEQIVIEIVESKVQNVNNLKSFIDKHRNYGFSIALDDVGAGHSNLDRIPLIKPDIVKLNGKLIQNLDTSFYQQEIFKSLTNVSKKLGALVIAEWVENEDDALLALEFGADFLQGFYFDTPKPVNDIELTCCFEKIDYISIRYEENIISKMEEETKNHAEYQKISKEVSQKLVNIEILDSELFLKDLIAKYKPIECLYLLNQNGKQITETVFNYHNKPKKSLLYYPAIKGTDHSMKDFYFVLKDLDRHSYMTQPYISAASGNLCITYSIIFYNKDNNQYILCLDINVS